MDQEDSLPTQSRIAGLQGLYSPALRSKVLPWLGGVENGDPSEGSDIFSRGPGGSRSGVSDTSLRALLPNGKADMLRLLCWSEQLHLLYPRISPVFPLALSAQTHPWRRLSAALSTSSPTLERRRAIIIRERSRRRRARGRRRRFTAGRRLSVRSLNGGKRRTRARCLAQSDG